MSTLLYIIGWLLWIAFGAALIFGIVFAFVSAWILFVTWRVERMELKEVIRKANRERAIE